MFHFVILFVWFVLQWLYLPTYCRFGCIRGSLSFIKCIFDLPCVARFFATPSYAVTRSHHCREYANTYAQISITCDDPSCFLHQISHFFACYRCPDRSVTKLYKALKTEVAHASIVGILQNIDKTDGFELHFRTETSSQVFDRDVAAE